MDALGRWSKEKWPPTGTTISPSRTKLLSRRVRAAKTTSGKYRVRSWPDFEHIVTASPSRVSRQRKPSHLGSYCHSFHSESRRRSAPPSLQHVGVLSSCRSAFPAPVRRRALPDFRLRRRGFLTDPALLQGIHQIDDVAFLPPSSGTSIVLPAALRLTKALSAVSYLSLNLCVLVPIQRNNNGAPTQ
jgi:hypothetical protein